ncbi:MAG: hypothetical protein PHE25_03675 [Candidatus Gracilibacteria bacterium]|nr:hypothetical protein [Candidatus Gracilibacteria bacterium]
MTKKPTFLPTEEVKKFEQPNSGDYDKLIVILEKQIAQLIERLEQLEASKKQLEQDLIIFKSQRLVEGKRIKPELDELNAKLKSLGNTKEDKAKKKEIKAKKDEIKQDYTKIDVEIKYNIPQKLQSIQDEIKKIQQKISDEKWSLEKVKSNPIAFCEEMKRKVNELVLSLPIGSTGEVNNNLKVQLGHYNSALLKALSIADLPVDESKFDVRGTGHSGGKVASSGIPYWKDEGGTHND